MNIIQKYLTTENNWLKDFILANYENNNINVVYNGNENVAIYTNGGSLTVNRGSVTHYGVAYLLTVSDSANFTENGTHAANSEDIVEVSNEYTLVNSLEETINVCRNYEYMIK